MAFIVPSIQLDANRSLVTLLGREKSLSQAQGVLDLAHFNEMDDEMGEGLAEVAQSDAIIQPIYRSFGKLAAVIAIQVPTYPHLQLSNAGVFGVGNQHGD